MVIRLNDAARNAAADAVVATFSAGSGTPVLRIYTDSQPATPATAPSGTLLAEFTLDDPAFAAAAGGSAVLDVAPALTDDGLAAGVAGWFRICTSTEAAGTGLGVMDGSVTATGGGGDLTLNTTTISVGVSVEITGGSVTMPAAA
jgi:hypothetical protein